MSFIYTVNNIISLFEDGTSSFLASEKHLKCKISFSFLIFSIHLQDYNARLSDFEVEHPSLGQYTYPFQWQYTYPFQNDAFYAAPEWFNYHFLNLERYEDTTVSQFEDGMSCLEI